MSDKKLLYVDVDGVLANNSAPLLTHVNQKHGTSFTEKDINKWDAVLKNGVFQIKIIDVISELYANKSFLIDLPTIQDAPLSMAMLAYNGYKLIVATKRSDMETTGAWLVKNFIIFDDLVHVENKGELKGGVGLIDDNPEFIMEYLNTNPTSMGYLFDAPHNKRFMHKKHHGHIKRVKDWMQIIWELGIMK